MAVKKKKKKRPTPPEIDFLDENGEPLPHTVKSIKRMKHYLVKEVYEDLLKHMEEYEKEKSKGKKEHT